MTHRNIFRQGLAFTAVAAISTLAFAPAAMAAGTVSQAEATAANISIAGNAQGTGTVAATNDGTGENKTGQIKPVLGDTLLPDLGVNAGVLYQDAKADVENGDGISAACAGLGGDGASLVELGKGNCLQGGDDLNFQLGQLDVDKLVLAGDLSPLAALSKPLADALAPITNPLQTGVVDALKQQLNLSLRVGTVQAWCTAEPTAVDGNGNVTGPLQLAVTAGGQQIALVNIPISTAPNQKVLTGLDGVTQAVIDGIKTELNTLVAGQLAPLKAVIDPLNVGLQTVQDQIVTTLVKQLQPLLQPLEQNVLDGTINKQSRTDKTIEITALDLQVIPAAAQALGTSLVGLEIGHVKCGPNDRVTVTENPVDDDTPVGGDTPGDQTLPDVPTKVTSGAEQATSDLRNARATVLGAMGALLLMAGAGGVMRRRFSQF